MGEIPLRIVEPFPEGEREAGMMWRYSAHDRPDRECWWVVLPATHPDIGTPGHPSQISWCTTDNAYDGSGMWAVSGTPPLITVTPSIDVMRFVLRDGQTVREGSYWHGFITNGRLLS